MDIEEVKQKLIIYRKQEIESRGCCDVEDFSKDVEFLLSVICRYEKALKKVEIVAFDQASRQIAQNALKPNS